MPTQASLPSSGKQTRQWAGRARIQAEMVLRNEVLGWTTLVSCPSRANGLAGELGGLQGRRGDPGTASQT